MPVMEEEVMKGVVNVDVPTGANDEQTETEVIWKFRDHTPAHYLFKIENFSLISDAKIDKYESGEFEVGGCKWKLCVYPKGKKKVNEEGHISLYLVLSESNSLPFHWEINVSFKLFVYNQILDKYLCVQDAKERVRRFRGAVREWGFEQFLPLNVFNDASNGYLVNDCCIFGAELLLALAPTSTGECASVVKKLGNNNTYTWNIENYRHLKGEHHYSPEFVIGGYKWTLCVYPNGYAKEEGKSMGMYLCLDDSKALDPGERLQVRYIIRIRGQIEESKDVERLANKPYSALSWCSGFHDLMTLSYLNDPSQGYVNPNGIMIAEVQILLMTLVKDFY